VGAGDERKVTLSDRIAETVRRHRREIPNGYPNEENPVPKRITAFALSLMAFLAVAAPALANGNWGG